MFNCSTEEVQSGACVAQSGEQLYVPLNHHITWMEADDQASIVWME